MMGTLQLGVLALLIYFGMEGAAAIGTLLLVQVYITQLISQLWGLSGMTRNIEQALSDANEMTEILGGALEVKDQHDAKKLLVKKGAIAFNDVTFTHDGNDDALFYNFSLQIKAGEKIGLVGKSGSGKTSLTKLLLRFTDIDGGTIEIDGQDIAKVRQADVRSTIAYVPQEPLLFHRTLRENIAYGMPNATESDIIRAAKLAHAHEFVNTLPHGYETMVGERGVKLSGGQRQRIAIARALLKNAPILVLDEATSALDSESEKLIQDALKHLMKGRTTIVIAHRLSTIQNMDRIVVLDNGTILEQGSHAELLKTDGTYASLWKRQSGGFLED
jgi:ATP-binding cassette subfamily B protein